MWSVALFLLWLLIPGILVLAALLFRDAGPADEDTTWRSKLILAGLIVSVATSSMYYRLVVLGRLEQTAMLFIGVPTLLAVAAVFTPRPRTAIGTAIKAVTIGLLISIIFLWEGVLCVVMSAPIFYVIAILGGWAIDSIRKKDAAGTRMMSMIVLLSLGPMSLEGVSPVTSFNRNMTVSETRVVNAPAGDVERALFSQPRFDRTLPRYLRAGFPRPIHVEVGQPAVGSQWTIRFRGGETHLNGQEPADGDLVLEIDELSAGRVSWHAVSDTSHVTHFLQWRGARVEWQPLDATHTRVTWTTNYRRGLDPAWYFGPMERYAMQLATGYLIDSVATP